MPSRPDVDRHADPKGWERAWERILEIAWAPGPGVRPRTMNLDLMFKMQRVMGPLTRDAYTDIVNGLCHLQNDIAKGALSRLVGDSFEVRWLSLPAARREYLLLDALVKAADIAKEMEDRREWCPEITVKGLAADGGRRYIVLLKAHIPSQSTIISSPVDVLPNQLILDSFKVKAEDVNMKEPTSSIELDLILRTYFISVVVWYTMLGFVSLLLSHDVSLCSYRGAQYGSTEPAVRIVPKISTIAEQKKDRDQWALLLGKREATKCIRQAAQEHKDLQAASQYCHACKRVAQPGEESFKKCSQCITAGRTVFYCSRYALPSTACPDDSNLTQSRECQVYDWKKGNPRPHKVSCGQPLEDVFCIPAAPTAEDDPNFPPPDSGFRRTLALLHQIAFLKKDRRVDYVVRTHALHFGERSKAYVGYLVDATSAPSRYQHPDR
jgi:hypothetical protein